MAKKEESAFEKGVEAVKEIVEKVEEAVEEFIEGDSDEDKKKVKKTKKKADETEKSDKENKKEVKKSKLDELKEKAKALEGKFQDGKEKDIRGEVKGEKEEKKDMLVPIEDYLKSSIHLGTRVITPDMRRYVYKRRADGLAVFNTNFLDDKIKEGAEYLAQFAPEDIVIVCKREAGWKAVRLFGETLGIKTFTKKYPAGSLTNPNLDVFFETDLVVIFDPWLDKNALKDAQDVKLKVMGICDTNNFIKGINKVVPGNNKSAKSIGMIMYLLAKLYAEKRKMKVEIPAIDEFVEGWAEAQIPA